MDRCCVVGLALPPIGLGRIPRLVGPAPQPQPQPPSPQPQHPQPPAPSWRPSRCRALPGAAAPLPTRSGPRPQPRGRSDYTQPRWHHSVPLLAAPEVNGVLHPMQDTRPLPPAPRQLKGASAASEVDSGSLPRRSTAPSLHPSLPLLSALLFRDSAHT